MKTFYERIDEILKSDGGLTDVRRLVSEYREAERWHLVSEGDMPKRGALVYCVWESEAPWPCQWDGENWWGYDGPEQSPPARWRYLSPADAPRNEPLQLHMLRKNPAMRACVEDAREIVKGWHGK